MYHFINKRTSSTHKALELADTYRIVEIGGGKDEDEPFTSTFFWAKQSHMLISLNENKEITDQKKEACKKNKFRNVMALNMSVEEWAPSFFDQINILYMDQWGEDVEGYQDKYVEAYELVKDKLGNKSVIVVDNTPKLSPRGCGVNLIDAAKYDGWIVAKQDQQVVLAKRRS
jgi:hypothetical protein